ncbi:MAG: type II toxin-antitoxin system HipA family toxin, partial [Candidatus Binataceae bacterium]
GNAYPLSLSMPLAAAAHKHEVITAFLWGLLPDNERTLDHYGRLFGVSAGNPVALLSHIGADCAGAVQFAPPEQAASLAGSALGAPTVEWVSESEIARELRTLREQGIPGTSARTLGQFSLAGAQPKLALFQERGRWARPTGRTPTNRILKPPTGEFRGFAENEHFCLELAGLLGVGSVTSRVTRFKDEVAIVVERFDRIKHGRAYHRIHQEDVCQALGVMPTRKYENEGGPGVTEIFSLLRGSSSKPQEDIERFLRVTILGWVLVATDAHAKNFALLHGPGGQVRLAPFYDIVSFLPYADPRLHRVKLAMKVGGEYLVRRITRRNWESLAKGNGLTSSYMLEAASYVLEQLTVAIDVVAQRAIKEGLAHSVVEPLAERVRARTKYCSETMRVAAGDGST